MRLYSCPCCEAKTPARTTPVSDSDCARGYMFMRARGWTAERLLAERFEDIDGMSPSMTAWLVKQAAEELKQ
jgi:hypothetical protein